MGLPVHANFSVAILQTENGEMRFKKELVEIRQQGIR